jgi:hypothetical protein
MELVSIHQSCVEAGGDGAGCAPSARISSSVAVFQSVTTSARALTPMRSAVEAQHERRLSVFSEKTVEAKSRLLFGYLMEVVLSEHGGESPGLIVI